MVNVIDLYYSVALDDANKDSNGTLSFERFNRLSKRAELKLIDWISGDISGEKPPEPYTTQKDKDFLSPFITKYPAQIVNGAITKPSDYYGYENMYRLGNKLSADCEEEAPASDGCNTTIELLDGSQFNERCNTEIDELKPSFNLPISKLVGKQFEFIPNDLGSVVLEYIRYPKYGEIKTKMDTVYNEEVPDPATSIDYEWDDKAMNLLIWFIVDMFCNHNREQALKQFNAITGKTPRG